MARTGRWWDEGRQEARAEMAVRHPRASEGGYRLVGLLLGVALVLAGSGMVASRALGPGRSGAVSLVALALLVASALLTRRQKRALAGPAGDRGVPPRG